MAQARNPNGTFAGERSWSPAGEATIVDGSGKVRLMTLADLDRRTGAAYRAHTMVKQLHEDLGGEDRLATGERQLIQRAALLGVLAEDLEARWLLGQSIDTGTLCAIGNAQRRLFESVGLRRRPRDVTPKLSTYLANAEVTE
jgi:hypothetical protein